jgi:hypothetical protein
MSAPEIDPLVKAVAEDRAHAIDQLVIDARRLGNPFPSEDGEHR